MIVGHIGGKCTASSSWFRCAWASCAQQSANTRFPILDSLQKKFNWSPVTPTERNPCDCGGFVFPLPGAGLTSFPESAHAAACFTERPKNAADGASAQDFGVLAQELNTPAQGLRAPAHGLGVLAQMLDTLAHRLRGPARGLIVLAHGLFVQAQGLAMRTCPWKL